MADVFKLAIVIPTFNRSEYLSIILDEIIKQAKAYSNKIEIIISDNCSTDNTEAVVVSKAYDNLRYYKQAENIGFMKNFEYLSSVVNSEYIWYLGDDDIPTPGALTKVLDIVEKEVYSMLYLNYQPYDMKNTQLKKFRQEKDDIIFQDGKDLFSFVNLGLQFISAVIVNTKHMTDATEKLSNTFDKEVHIIEFMDVLCQDKAYFISDVMVLVGYTDQRLKREGYSETYFVKKTNWFEVFFIYPQSIMRYAIKNLSYEKKHMINYMSYSDYQFIRTYAYKKKENQKIDYEFISFFDGIHSLYSLSWKVKFVLVYLSPSIVLKTLWRFSKKVFGR